MKTRKFPHALLSGLPSIALALIVMPLIVTGCDKSAQQQQPQNTGDAQVSVEETVGAAENMPPLEGEMYEQHAAHEHGHALLTIGINDDSVDMMLESPAVNILGYEHEPVSDADKAALEKQTGVLKNAAGLFEINEAAGCKFMEARMESEAIDNTSVEQEEKHVEEHEDGHEHRDIVMIWNYECRNAGALESIAVKLFSAFPGGFEQIKAEWITPDTASSAVLTEDGTVTIE